MIQTSTQNLLVLHAYNETTPLQKQQLAKEMALNETLHEELMELLRGKKLLDSKLSSPSETSVQIILRHACKAEHLQEI